MHGLWGWKRQVVKDGESGDFVWPAEAVGEGLLWGCAVGTAAVKIRGASNPSSPEDILDLLAQQKEKHAVEY